MECTHVATVCSGAVSRPPVAAWSTHGTTCIATAGVLPSNVAIWKLTASNKEVSRNQYIHSIVLVLNLYIFSWYSIYIYYLYMVLNLFIYLLSCGCCISAPEYTNQTQQ